MEGKTNTLKKKETDFRWPVTIFVRQNLQQSWVYTQNCLRIIYVFYLTRSKSASETYSKIQGTYNANILAFIKLFKQSESKRERFTKVLVKLYWFNRTCFKSDLCYSHWRLGVGRIMQRKSPSMGICIRLIKLFEILITISKRYARQKQSSYNRLQSTLMTICSSNGIQSIGPNWRW